MSKPLHSSPDVIVVGAGIVGAACAHELAQQGADVLVLDRAGVGGGVSAAGMGHLVLMDDSPAEFALSAWSRDLWLDLAPRLTQREAFARCGTLWVAVDDEEYELAQTRRQALTGAGVACTLLDAQQVREAEPALREGLRGGMLLPDDAVVYAPAAAAWLLAQPVKGRVTCRLDTQVARVDRQGVVLADGETLATGAVLLANGLQAADLLPGLPMQEKKGHLIITDRYPGTIRHQILELGYIKSAHNASGTSVAFNVQPRPTGQILIGSSRQFDSVDPAIEPGILARMLRRAAQFLPELPTLNAIRAWTGFRPATSDGLPLIGPAGPFASETCHRSTWLATGHEGLGVTTALATGKLIAAQMLGLGDVLPIDPAPYRPARFEEAGVSHV
ncbi:glycine/D-amino acid oxidase-like deaminating enzyme [Paraburkholderia bannensis]|uniref:Glycine/D-amino acid oxidase-like deaminating enzyme n=1 Tax=Paraburkholderia bannensis TaxID=765414 RepID=A0A7W9U0H8_9BURK|nr:glycine/D-amino acid oxidase-like deaminating enzyme [Paraburkholderia sp. WP4_3_2]MBB6104016.1 glycine/D-amino acid oxidase-like deaminating enzyme [Paraburkholderia bannensis]